MEVKRTLPQNRKFSAIVGEVAYACPLIPYRRAFAEEAWRRFFIAGFVRDARLSAFYEGRPDPFPVRPVPSSELDSAQYSELIEFTCCYCAQHGIELSR